MANVIVDATTTSRTRNRTRNSQLVATATQGPQKSISAKLVLLGDAGVGKSSIALRFVRGEFHANSDATIGAAFFTQTTTLEDQTIKFAIWDTAGQERYQCIAPMYYRGAQAAIVVFDATSKYSYERALSWIRELGQKADPQIVVTLAGNKSDMEATSSNNLLETARMYAAENGIAFAETSAKTGRGVHKIFMDIAIHLSEMARVSRYQEIQNGFRLTGNAGRKFPEVCHC